jgi:hypothetical protein
MRRSALAALVLTCLLAPADAAGIKPLVKHEEPDWTWVGPRTWFAESDATSIAITNPKQTSGIEYVGSNVTCAGKPKERFKQGRREFRKAAALRNLEIENSRTKRIGGTLVNTFEFSGRTSGKRVRGEVRFIYSTELGDECFFSSLLEAAAAKGYDRSIELVRKVARSIVYRGTELPI